MENMPIKLYDEMLDLFEKHFNNIIEYLDSLDRESALLEKADFYRDLGILLRKYSN